MGAEQYQNSKDVLINSLNGLFNGSVYVAGKCMEGYRRDFNLEDAEKLRAAMVSASNNVKSLEKKLDKEQFEDLKRNFDDVSEAVGKYLSRGDLLSDVAVSKLLFVTHYAFNVLRLLDEGKDYTDDRLNVVPGAEQGAEASYLKLKEKIHELRRARKYEKMRLAIWYS